MKILLIILIAANAIIWTSSKEEPIHSYLISDEDYRCKFNQDLVHVCRSMQTGQVKTKYQVEI